MKTDSTVSAPAAAGPRPKTPEPFTLVIFGATGDLTHRKLVPALYELFREQWLPADFAVIGFARRDKTEEQFRRELYEAAQVHARSRPVRDPVWTEFARRISYLRSDFTDPEGYRRLRRLVDERARTSRACNVLCYLATPPEAVPDIVAQLNRVGLSRAQAHACPWTRLIVEKPFGRDLASARRLNAHLNEVFSEDQIFRIDHYLGKEAVQNLLVLRFANAIFEPIWNQKYVDHVQITVSETVGMEGRGRTYDQLGAVRDMVQNHLMHLLCLVAMEAPVSLEAEAIRNEKIKVLEALRPLSAEGLADRVVRAQYTPAGDLPGYLQEPGVAPGSTTETFAALKVFVDNWRWAGVPFYLRTGKRLPVRISELSIHFKPVPPVLFNAPPYGPMAPNVMAIRIQPNEGIAIRFQVKEPGPAMTIRSFDLDFGYAPAFGREPPEAYERLLLEAALGDSTLFTRRDEVEAAWAFLSPILEWAAARAGQPLPGYPAGSWGPKEADDLIQSDGRRWELFRRRSSSPRRT